MSDVLLRIGDLAEGYFSPEQIAGLMAWYKADALTGLADAAPIPTWYDSSGLGNHATNAIAAQQPLYKTNIVNGRPVVRFDGANDVLLVPAFGAGETVATVFAVAKSTTGTGASHIWDGEPAGGNRATIYIQITSNKFSIFQGIEVPGTVATTAWNMWCGVFDATDNLYINGVVNSSGNGGANAITGAKTIGSSNAGSANAPWNGDIAEIIVYNTALSDGNRRKVEKYLVQKYNLPYGSW